jgi:hypothetical protein
LRGKILGRFFFTRCLQNIGNNKGQIRKGDWRYPRFLAQS